MFKVLVIDDTEDVRMLTTDMLSMNGYDVTAVASGSEGLEAARRCPPDLVLCDVQMPEWDGFETFAQLRAVPALASIPFIFLTGMGDKPVIRRGMELGADDYLTKPFTLSELLGAVRTQLDKKAAITEQTEQKLDRLRGNISTALPHELLTPLTAIIGFSSLIVEDHATMPPAEMVESARHIHQSAVRLRRMIENFLLCAQIDLAAADPGRLAGIRAARCPALPETLERAAARVAAEQRREGDFQFLAAPAVLSMAPEQVEKIATELLENAFKFSQPGTTVRLLAGTERGCFRIHVEDAGRGFTPEQIQSIGAHMQFERGQYEQQGLGLGLAIVKRLAELHGGRLEIESQPGVFSKVSVQLPLAEAA